MIKLEDILDDAARYLHGEMDADEQSFFEELLEDNPHLKEELALFQRVKAGFQWMEEHKPPPDNKKKGGGFNFSWILLLLLGVIAVWSFFEFSKTLPQINTQPIRPVFDDLQTGTLFTQLGGSSIEDYSDRGLGVTWTSQDEIAFSGIFMEELKIGNTTIQSIGGRDMLLGIYNLDRGFQWIRPLGSNTKLEAIYDIAVGNADHLILTGSIGDGADFGGGAISMQGTDNWGTRDFFIAKYRADGQLLWVDHAGGQRVDHLQTGINCGMKLQITSDDHILATGVYLGSPVWQDTILPEGGPNEDVYLAKYSPEGQLRWVSTATSDYRITSWGIASDRFQHVFVAGYFGHQNLIGSAYFENTKITSFGGGDIFLAKYDANGHLLWVRQAGSDDTGKRTGEVCFDLAVDADGYSIITGRFTGKARFDSITLESYGGPNMFLAKYNPEGQVLWARQAGSPAWKERKLEQGNALTFDNHGNIIVTGSFTGLSRFEDLALDASGSANDCFVAQYSPDGELIWIRHLGEFGQIEKAAGWGVDVNQQNEIVITGYFSGSINPLGPMINSMGEADIFVLVIDNNGRILSLRQPVALTK